MEELTTVQIVALAGVIYTIVCGTFGAYAAAVKNRAGFEGFTFGAILGAFGVIAVACLPTLATTPAQRALERQEYWQKTLDARIAASEREQKERESSVERAHKENQERAAAALKAAAKLKTAAPRRNGA